MQNVRRKPEEWRGGMLVHGEKGYGCERAGQTSPLSTDSRIQVHLMLINKWGLGDLTQSCGHQPCPHWSAVALLTHYWMIEYDRCWIPLTPQKASSRPCKRTCDSNSHKDARDQTDHRIWEQVILVRHTWKKTKAAHWTWYNLWLWYGRFGWCSGVLDALCSAIL